MSGKAELPYGWVACQLKDICEIRQGQSPPSSSYVDVAENRGVPFIQGNAEFGDIRPEPQKRTTEPRVIARPGSVLVSVRAPVGDVNLSPPEPTAIGRGLSEVRGEDGISPGYLFWLLRGAHGLLKAKATGTTFEAITGRVLSDLPVWLPPGPEQDRIVHELERVSAEIVSGMAEVEEVLRLLAQMRQRLLAGIADDADTIALSHVATIQSGITKNAAKEVGLREIAYLRTANVQAGRLDLNEIRTIGASDDQIRRHRLQPGDVLVLEGGDADKVGRGWIWNGEIEECLHQNHVFAIRPNSKLLDSRFLAYYVNAAQARAYFLASAKQTTNLASINKAQLSTLPVPKLPVEEQRLRVLHLEAGLADIEELETEASDMIRLSARLKEALLASALSGRLVAQDPAEESASVLVEGIKAARAEREPKRSGLRSQAKKPRTARAEATS